MGETILLITFKDDEMSITLSKYQGKPVVYLDQNVLSLFVKDIDRGFFEELINRFQVVYSDETLREIKRCGKNFSIYLDALEVMGAVHFRFDITHSFEVLDRVIVKHVSPREAYDDFCKIEPVFDLMFSATRQSTLKFFGGRQGSNLDDINSEQIFAFEKLMEHISTTLEEFDDVQSEIQRSIREYQKLLQDRFNKVIKLSTAQMRQHISNEQEWSGVRDYREATGTGPIELNNIKSPNVIEKIWALYQNLEGYKDAGFSIEQFLGISSNPIYNREMYMHEKVGAIYNLLNVIGYNQDSGLTQDARHIAATSDAAHAAIAANANILLSADKAFVAKMRAIYEYLELDTAVGLIVVSNGVVEVV